ncbi:MAG: PSD1 and planctomycete cytochrome C domain-containing protein [Planctomycetota bacterium]|nr:PSD1 and planctomycete cytochrome C domain-containing protein [Planctomycetota bacterium]
MILLLLVSMMMDETPALPQQTLSDEHVRFFETEVRPLLTDHCLDCHGPKRQWAGLRLDSRDAMLKGGDTGPAVIPQQPDASLLIHAVRHESEDLQMPQDDKLSDRQIETLVQWVAMGVPYPVVPSTEKRFRDPGHWSFQPLVVVPVPEVQNTTWVRSEVDRFVLAGLEADELKAAPIADKRTLIRRMTFDLTGLPPTPDEIASFLTNERPDAYAQLVERLLASPAYGERWGRHWLDVARYADSNGLDENVAQGNAWRYRDYVVASINADKPFDRFITEQIAGDLLESESDDDHHQNLIATGFLSIGPKVLAEVNQPKMRMDIVDEQIDTVGRAFLGMTFGCARCHDHKFDPIDAADYYGLAGIFKSTRTMDTYIKVAKWHEYPLKTAEAAAIQAEYDARVTAKKQEIKTLVVQANELAKNSLTDPQTPPESLETLYPEATRTEIARLRDELATLETTPPELPSAMGVIEDEVADVAIHVRGNPSQLGDIVQRHVPPVMHGPTIPAFSSAQSGRKELAQWLTDAQHPLTARVLVNRFWRWHFGEGLVRTTDNFGVLGERPSHPELLDWLAMRFMADGWSLKSFHRLVLNSSTYQQSSVASAETTEQDPENRLLGRFRVRRLDAEEIRDAILQISGMLDRTMGGSLLKVRNRGYLFDHTSIDKSDYSSHRRSLYLPVIRNNVFDVFQLLDFPDPAVPTGDRSTTTVAPQALMMMNSDFVMQSADDVAKQICEVTEDTTERLVKLYQLTVGRDPNKSEQIEDLAFLKQMDQALQGSELDDQIRSLQSWGILCHVVIASSEFIYVQ